MLQKLSHCFCSKKFLALLLVLILLIGGVFLLCKSPVAGGKESCEQQLARAAANLSGAFSATLEIKYDDFAANVQYEQRYIGDSTFRFTSPPSLDGFELTIADGAVNLSYRGLGSTMNTDQFFSASGAGMFLTALENIISQQGFACAEENGVLTLTMPAGEEEPTFLAQLDTQSGAIIKLEFPQENVSINVSDFTMQ